jgi:hypothetical protein
MKDMLAQDVDDLEGGSGCMNIKFTWGMYKPKRHKFSNSPTTQGEHIFTSKV